MISILLVNGLFLTDIFIILLITMINGLSLNIFGQSFSVSCYRWSNLCLSVYVKQIRNIRVTRKYYVFYESMIQIYGLIHSHFGQSVADGRTAWYNLMSAKPEWTIRKSSWERYTRNQYKTDVHVNRMGIDNHRRTDYVQALPSGLAGWLAG